MLLRFIEYRVYFYPYHTKVVEYLHKLPIWSFQGLGKGKLRVFYPVPFLASKLSGSSHKTLAAEAINDDILAKIQQYHHTLGQ